MEMRPELHQDPFPKRPTVDIQFSDVTYQVVAWDKLKPVPKKILHGVSGEFRSGEVTVIMGPSGAGKTTLLNILAGYVVRGSEGLIKVNGEERGQGKGLEEFKKISCYIQQEDVVRRLLRVKEAMMMAIHLKLGCNLTHVQKQRKICELLDIMRLSETLNTFCKDLSGGQKKRLSIALELVTNPPIIFLDEPTTGLDCVSTKACIELMKQLSNQGRTIICTLHQPSATLLPQFSQIYCVAEGKCIFQGPPMDLVPFFSTFGLNCPPYHNPADFMIEIASGDHPRDIDYLAKEAVRKGNELTAISSKLTPDENGLHKYSLKKSKKRSETYNSDISAGSCLPKPTSLWLQCFHLYNRNLMVLRRDVAMIFTRIICHLIIGIVFGYIYQGVGNNAKTLLANFIFVYGSNLFLLYTGLMTVLLSFPLEYEVLTREHFNRWYSLAPYCISLLLIEIPFQVMCVVAYLIPAYYLTEQPLELSRIGMFFFFNVAITITAQSTGFLSGAIMPITVAVFLAPVFSVFFSVFGFCSRYYEIPAYMRPLYNISYFRAGFQGSFTSLYLNNRSELPCPEGEIYCHYRFPSKFLSEWELSDFQPIPELCFIIFIGALGYSATLLTVWSKLTRR